MPTAIPGVNYLSGGQSLEDCCARLSAINSIKTSKNPWNISFSWSAAIQMPLFTLCKKHNGNLDVALPDMEKLYIDELKLAADASMGVYRCKDKEGAHYPGKKSDGSD